MNAQPKPPFLVIRKGLAFWIERSEPTAASATVQAFEEGCFSDACCYDATGALWPIVRASLKTSPSLAERTIPWRQVQVDLHLGPPNKIAVAEVVSLLADILLGESEFAESLDSSADVLKRFREAVTPADVIQVALTCE